VSARAEAEQILDPLTGLLHACVDDPELFFTEFLRVKSLRRWQKKLCAQIRARLRAGDYRISVLVRSCHGAGKTWFVAGLLIWFIVTRPNSRGLTTAPTWKQVKDTLWAEISKLYRGSILPGHFGHVLESRFETGRKEWFASGVSSDHMENIEGQHSPTAAIRIVDEAKAVEQGMFDATKGIFTAPEILDVWISTPSIQSGPFYERDVSDDESVIRAVVDIDELCNDPNIPAGERAAFANWKQECLLEWGEASSEYQSRVMARYIDNAEGALYPSSWVERAMAAEWEIDKPLVAALDVAGTVDGDENALAIAAGPDNQDKIHVRSLASWHERDTMVTKGKLLLALRGLGPIGLRVAVYVDANGLGKGVADAARYDGVNVGHYVGSTSPRDPSRYQYRKYEDAWHLRDLLEKNLIRLPRSQALKAQLCAMRYEVLINGKIRIIDPVDSPDLVDAVIMACAGMRQGKGFFSRTDDRRYSPADFRAF
jgi:phage terminase large subunit